MKKERKALAASLGDVLTAKISETGEPGKKVQEAISKAAEELAKKLLKLKKKEEEKAKEKSEKARKKEAAKARKAEIKAQKKEEKGKKKGQKDGASAEKPVLQPETPAAVETPTLVSADGEALSAGQSTTGRPAPRSRTVKAATPVTNGTLDTNNNA